MNWLKKLLGIYAAQPMPGKPLQAIASELNIPELPEVYRVTEEKILYTVMRNGITDTLRIEPHKDGFALCIDVSNTDIKPTLRLVFREVMEGRFEPSGCTLHRGEDGHLFLPCTRSIPPIRAVTNAFVTYVMHNSATAPSSPRPIVS